MFGLVKMAVALLCAAAIAGPATSEGSAGGFLSAGERVTTTGDLSWPDGREYTAVAGDGDIYVAGVPQGAATVELRRYLPGGALDASFGENGVVAFAESGDAPFRLVELLVDPFGLPYLVGGTGSDQVVVARFAEDGTLDRSYGSGGIARVDLGRPAASGPLATIDQQSRIVLAARRVVRLDPSGAPDADFGDGGKVSIPGGVADGLGVDQEGGVQLLLPGGPGAHAGGFRLMRLNSAGGPDRSLGPTGIQTYSGIGVARPLTVSREGASLVLGTTTRSRHGGVARILEVGSRGIRARGGSRGRRLRVRVRDGDEIDAIVDDPNGFDYLVGKEARRRPGARSGRPRERSFVVALTRGRFFVGFPSGGRLEVAPGVEAIVRGLSITDGSRKILLDGIARRGPNAPARGFIARYPAAEPVITYAPEAASR